MKIDKRWFITYKLESTVILLLLGVIVFFASAIIVRCNMMPYFIAKTIILAIPFAIILTLAMFFSFLLIICCSIYLAALIHSKNVRKEMLKKEKAIPSNDFAPIKVKKISKAIAFSYINPNDFVCVAKEEKNGEISYRLTLDAYGKATNYAMFMEAFELL